MRGQATQLQQSPVPMQVEWGLVRKRHVPDRLDVVMFSAAAAAIMHCYSDSHGRHRDVFRSKYLNYLDFVLGSEGARPTPCCACARA